MESLQEILSKKDFKKPDEMQALGDYINRKYGKKCSIKLQRDALIVSVSNSALAATLQLERQNIIKSCGITKKLVFRTY